MELTALLEDYMIKNVYTKEEILKRTNYLLTSVREDYNIDEEDYNKMLECYTITYSKKKNV